MNFKTTRTHKIFISVAICIGLVASILFTYVLSDEETKTEYLLGVKQEVSEDGIEFTQEVGVELEGEASPSDTKEDEPKEVVIDLKGAVNKPGVYTLNE